MIISLNIDPTTHATAFAQVIALATANGIEFGIVDTKTPTPTSPSVSAPQPKAEKPKAIAPATDTTLVVTMNGKDGFTLGYGSGRAGAKLLVKAHGFTWNADRHAYVGGDLKALALKGRGTERTLTVPAEWVQKGRDKAAEKAAKRG